MCMYCVCVHNRDVASWSVRKKKSIGRTQFGNMSTNSANTLVAIASPEGVDVYNSTNLSKVCRLDNIHELGGATALDFSPKGDVLLDVGADNLVALLPVTQQRSSLIYDVFKFILHIALIAILMYFCSMFFAQSN
jgi:WD40 repeat protein